MNRLVESLQDFLRDLYRAGRRLVAAPAESLAAVLVIALGAGVNLAVLAVMHASLLQPLPYERPQELALLSVRTADGGDFGVLASEVPAWREHLRSAESVASYAAARLVLRGDGEALLAPAARVDREFFTTLRPLGARGALVEGKGAVLDEALARRLFAASSSLARDLVGRELAVGEGLLRTAAVLPAVGLPARETVAWLPEHAAPPAVEGDPRRLLVRLRPAASVEDLEAEAARVLARLRGFDADDASAASVAVVPLEESLRAPLRPALTAAGAAALLVLLVTCGNVALYTLGRAAVGRRRAAVQMALGAGRFEAVRAPLVETALLATAGLVAGSVLALALLGTARRFDVTATIHPAIWAAGALSILGVMLLTAGAAAVRRLDIAGVLRSARQGTAGAGRWVAALVMLQIAASMVLLVGAGLLGRTVQALLDQDLGLETEGVVVAELHRGHAPGVAEQVDFADRLLAEVRRLPGVEAAGLGSDVPPLATPFRVYIRMLLGGRDEGRMVQLVAVTPGYLEALGVDAAGGRLFETRDRGEETVVLGRRAAAFLLPGLEAAGRTLHHPLPPVVPWEGAPVVAGEVDDLRFSGLDQEAAAAIFLPWRARPSMRSYLVLKTSGDSAALAPALRGVLRQVDPRLPRASIEPLEARVEAALGSRLLRAWVAILLALVALGVSLGGVAGLFLRAVAGRRREMAIRQALGSTPGATVALMLRRAAALAALGMALGSGVALWVSSALEHLLYGVAARDAVTFVAAAALVVVAALLAAWVPSRRLRRIAPATVLRQE